MTFSPKCLRKFASPIYFLRQYVDTISTSVWPYRGKASMHVISYLKALKHTHVPTPLYGHYLTHAHNYIILAVAVMVSCFVDLIWAHQYGIAVRSMKRRTRVSKTLYEYHCPGDMVVRMRKLKAITTELNCGVGMCASV